jgi:predicted Zn-ribbon and HTH transcriptional regulator
MDYSDFNVWLKRADVRLLHNPKLCGECGNSMRQQKAKRNQREGCWRCQRGGCNMRSKDVGYYFGTWFENTKITPLDVFR